MQIVAKAKVRFVSRVAVIELSGKITIGEGDILMRNKVDEVLEGGVSDIILDLERVTLMDGNYGGLGEMIACYKRVAAAGGKFKLLKPSPRVSDLLLVTRLTELFEIFDDENEALLAIRGRTPEAMDGYSLGLTVDEAGRVGIQVFKRFGAYNVAENRIVEPSLHGIWFPDATLFPTSEIKEFEFLLRQKPPSPERAYQEFFEAHPRWLYILGEQYEAAVPQVRLPPLEFRSTLTLADSSSGPGKLVPDFLLKRIGLELWDVLDIKASDARVVVGRSSRRRFSQAVSEAIAQLKEYRRRLHSPEVRQDLHRRFQMTISEPDAMVLVGRDFCFTSVIEKDQFREQDGVRIYTYDDLHRLAKQRAIS